MNKDSFIKELRNMGGIVAVCKFGSHGTDYWIEGRSDIDLAIIASPNINFTDTLNMEDKIEALSKDFYKYDNIHLTFIMFNEFHTKFARFAVDSEEQYIVDEERWYDFQHYVLKYARENRNFERMLKIDEQYTYFGGIIDDSLL